MSNENQPAFRIVDRETTVGRGRAIVCVAADSRVDFDGLNRREALRFAEQYLAGKGESSARMSSENGPYPATDGATDNQIGSGEVATAEWRMTFKFLSMP